MSFCIFRPKNPKALNPHTCALTRTHTGLSIGGGGEALVTNAAVSSKQILTVGVGAAHCRVATFINI